MMDKPVFTGRELAKAASADTNLQNIDITKAANGYTARARYEHKKKKMNSDGPSCEPYQEPETLVFANRSSLLEWLEEVLD